MKKLLKLSIIVSLFVPGIVQAKEVKILTITNDENSLIADMLVDIDEDNVIKKFHHRRYNQNGALVKSETFPATITDEGIVLVAKKSRKIVVMKGENVDAISGGILEISYLYNGVTGSRGLFEADLYKDSSGEWSIGHKKKMIKHIHAVSNKKRFVGTVGIRKFVVKR